MYSRQSEGDKQIDRIPQNRHNDGIEIYIYTYIYIYIYKAIDEQFLTTELR
jgi:hypothetical protein